MKKKLVLANLVLPIQIALIIWIYILEPMLIRVQSLKYYNYNISCRNIVELIITFVLIIFCCIIILFFIIKKNTFLLLIAIELICISIEFLIYTQHIHRLLGDYIPLSFSVTIIGIIPLVIINIYLLCTSSQSA